MKPGTLQFDARENAASQRRQASRQPPRPLAALALNTPTTSLRLSEHEDGYDYRSECSSVPASKRASTEAAREHPALLTVAEVAELLRVPVSWVYGRMRRRSTERLPAYKLGKYWRFREAEILAWVSSHQRSSDAS
jgi:excisionase family DNA binding protein